MILYSPLIYTVRTLPHATVSFSFFSSSQPFLKEFQWPIFNPNPSNARMLYLNFSYGWKSSKIIKYKTKTNDLINNIGIVDRQRHMLC